MEAVAKVKNQKGSPKRMRLVADLIRNQNVQQAQSILKFSKKKAARTLDKLLNTAIANAVNKEGKVETHKLFINRIFVDEGITMKRFRARAQGRADLIRKRTCHITLSVSDEYPDKKEKEESVGSKN
ncbi:MAG: 50S ribosomal protein L22 [Candidatus Cloacimonetes bacterium]|nr:50S ribosomal protein L22 [Candidatus Cloacimonadota bacterium]MBL7107860.1 50S ribosomal protein L22 [Candidatus Cloacimonadota bacterium]